MCWEIWTTTCQWMKVDHYLTAYTKINSKWIKDLRISPETIKLLDDHIGRTPFDIEFKKSISNTMSSQTRETKDKINKLEFIRLKTFCKVKETRIKTKRQPTKWEKIFANNLSDKGLISIIYKEHTTEQ